MYNKFLTIIIPSYNMEPYLPKCLGSLIIDDKELFQKLDVIVVNDGSNDNTSKIAHDFEAQYPGIFRVIDKENGHYGSCINAALPVANGEYVKILDADDSVETTSLSKLLRVIGKELEKGYLAPDLVVSDYIAVDSDGCEISRSKFGLSENMTELAEQDENGKRLTIHSICYKTKILRKMGYRQSEGMPYTDTEWIIEPMVMVRRIRYCPFIVTRYLVGRDGQTMDSLVFAKHFQSILDITIGLVGRYYTRITNCEKNSLGYYKKQVYHMINMSYKYGLLDYHGIKTNSNMEKFDSDLKQYQEFYTYASKLIFGPKCFSFKYVEEWRKRGVSLRWQFWITFEKLLMLVAKGHKKFKYVVNS